MTSYYTTNDVIGAVHSSSNNAKYLKCYDWKVESTRKLATLALIREISDANLETGGYSPKSGVSRINWES